MKKVLLLVVSLISLNSNGQEIKPLSFEGVIETNKSKKEVYLNTREWFFQNFNSYEGVMSVEDFENGVFYSKGILPDIYYNFSNNKLFKEYIGGYVKFSLRIYFKDNKCKYVFDSFLHQETAILGFQLGSIDKSFGLLTTSDESSTSSRTKMLVELKKIVDSKINELTIDLKDVINNTDISNY